MWMYQLLLADILKSTKKILQKNFTFCDYVTGFMKKKVLC